MCGIAGALDRDGRVEDKPLARMNAAQVHRGPDDGGLWVSRAGISGMAARRLAILDLSPAGHQPMVSDDGSLVLVFNGEIYNFLELRQELEWLGHRFRGSGDTEILLGAYQHWGPDCLQRLNGMFAFALWDEGRRRLFAARDRFGEKPFYYWSDVSRFVFASEIKALLLYPGVPCRPNPEAMRRYLALALSDGWEDTFFAKIRQLPAAHYLLVEPGQAPRLTRYWELPAASPAAGDACERVECFRELLLDSVRLRLRSDVPVGSSLSGGLDSSSVVGAMAALLKDDGGGHPHTFSARYQDGRVDEGRYVEAVAQLTGCQDHHVWLGQEVAAEEVEAFARQQDEPVISTGQFAQWKVMELARQYGVTVLLDGQGADETLAGYHPPAFGGRLAGLLRSGHLAGFGVELAGYRRRQGSPVRALRYLGGALLPERMRAAAQALLRGSHGLLPHGALPRAEPAPRLATPLKSALYEQITRTSLPALLRYEDRNSMAFSREARLPFLDHRLVEFAFSLPDGDLVSRGLTKVILRRAAAPWLPQLVRERADKIGFTTPEACWFRGPLRDWLRNLLDGAVKRGLCNAGAIEDEWQAVQSGRASSTANLWRAANLELWSRQFFD